MVYALPEDWLLRGLNSLAPVHAHLDFDKATTLPAFTRIDEGVLRSVRLTSLGYRLMECQEFLGAQFTVDFTKPKPFIVPEQPGKSQFRHPFYRPPVWMYSGRRNRGRYPHRHNHASHYHHNRQYGRGDFISGPNRWSTKRGYWFAHSRGGGNRGHGPRAHPVVFMNRQGKPARLGEPHTDPKSAPHSRRPPYGMKLSARSETDPSISPTRTGTGDLAKQSSNSSLPPAEVEGSPRSEENTHSNDPESRKAQLMHDMARLRLLSEVDQLARQCRNASPRAQQPAETDGNPESTSMSVGAADSSLVPENFVSPYLVLDAYCLTSHLPAVKQLAHSGAFVLIIPAAVIAHLDYLKKTMATSRYAIRYLEQETHSGNRYLRLQRPEEQPTYPLQLPRLVYPRNTNSGPVETENVDEIQNEAGPIANPRVVRRWTSIVDCAVYFSQLKTNEENSQTAERRNSQFGLGSLDGSCMSTNKPCGPGPSVVKASENTQSGATPKDDNPGVLINSPAMCCDLLTIFQKSHREPNPEQDVRNSLVTVLIGSRDTAPEDTIVPREFPNLVQNAGIRIELLRDFVQRWKKARRSSHSTADHKANTN
ncbi:hypothetical protein FGIG_08408 [Fasciola gigantica]|uniref:PIN domain-containing protein n=1 Tax=Fasciola gigantica TaxID=46835 RepID=A0A504YVJ7_FASGI|nr:hypothetical protein FGIG_08408 [Fasciola gigantica]